MPHDRTAAPRATPGDPGAADGDVGFSLVEVVVAMTVFVVMTVAVLAMLVSALAGTRSNAQRVQAANLAAQQIEVSRSLRPEAVPDGLSTPAVSGTTIQGTTYTVQQSAAFLSGDGSVSLCRSGAGRPTFKRVTVTVTWPDMGSVAPVRSDTVLALGVGSQDLDSTRGIAAVLVRDSAQAPLRGVSVTLASSTTGTATTVTDADGCAVFVNRPTGNYTAGADQSGFVGLDGRQAVSAAVGVEADKVGRTTLDYDRAAALGVVLVPPAGYALPAALSVPVTVDYASFSPNPRVYHPCTEPLATSALCSSEGPGPLRTVPRLFPGPASYGAWAGACPSAKPAVAPNRAVLAPGGTGRVEVPLAGVRITVTSASGAPAGRAVYAYPADSAASGCQSAPWRIATSTAGTVNVALPQGDWIFSLNGATAATATGSVRAKPTTTQPASVTLTAP